MSAPCRDTEAVGAVCHDTGWQVLHLTTQVQQVPCLTAQAMSPCHDTEAVGAPMSRHRVWWVACVTTQGSVGAPGPDTAGMGAPRRDTEVPYPIDTRRPGGVSQHRGAAGALCHDTGVPYPMI